MVASDWSGVDEMAVSGVGGVGVVWYKLANMTIVPFWAASSIPSDRVFNSQLSLYGRVL